VGRPVRVASVEEEDAILGACACGREWRLAAEDVVPISNRWYDALVVACPACGEVRRALFDITSFFAPPSNAWLLRSAG
jgi:hypothetical protein